ncbi:MAG: hypothetical protein GY786_11935 [Proteobacteria bacterium]|nr:hypothetical protein [Pseudomonadota bacterium]
MGGLCPFGSNAGIIIRNDPKLPGIPGTETSWAELVWSAENEQVVHLEDLMLRRTRLGLILENGGLDLLPEIRKHCQKSLGWNDDRWLKEKNAYMTRIHQNHSLPLYG